MQGTRNSIKTMAGPREWFNGAVYVDAVATPADRSRVNASSVHFTPGARTAWHTHPNGQTIFGDHWHGAAPTRFMTHIAMLDVDDKCTSATWGDHVSDAEYAAPWIGDGTSERH